VTPSTISSLASMKPTPTASAQRHLHHEAGTATLHLDAVSATRSRHTAPLTLNGFDVGASWPSWQRVSGTMGLEPILVPPGWVAAALRVLRRQ
jgi:hypothetical protein